MSAKIITYK